MKFSPSGFLHEVLAGISKQISSGVAINPSHNLASFADVLCAYVITNARRSIYCAVGEVHSILASMVTAEAVNCVLHKYSKMPKIWEVIEMLTLSNI